MSRVCEICKRGPRVGQTRSHSKVASKRWQGINLQIKTINGRRVRLCTKCIKTRAKK
ncbi:MAG: 50S ribosomal protein L28 [bacterium]|nr:50S ribosomal protein L28 [bacterium]